MPSPRNGDIAPNSAIGRRADGHVGVAGQDRHDQGTDLLGGIGAVAVGHDHGVAIDQKREHHANDIPFASFGNVFDAALRLRASSALPSVEALSKTMISASGKAARHSRTTEAIAAASLKHGIATLIEGVLFRLATARVFPFASIRLAEIGSRRTRETALPRNLDSEKAKFRRQCSELSHPKNPEATWPDESSAIISKNRYAVSPLEPSRSNHCVYGRLKALSGGRKVSCPSFLRIIFLVRDISLIMVYTYQLRDRAPAALFDNSQMTSKPTPANLGGRTSPTLFLRSPRAIPARCGCLPARSRCELGRRRLLLISSIFSRFPKLDTTKFRPLASPSPLMPTSPKKFV